VLPITWITTNTTQVKEIFLYACSDVDGGSYQLITFSLINASASVTDGKRGSRLTVFDRYQRQILIKNLNNETTKQQNEFNHRYRMLTLY